VAHTLVSFHAHPDDEVLLTGGTLARAAAEGHRVVLVTATNGEAGLAAGEHNRGGLAQRRIIELERSAAALGCARVVRLGFPDSGWGDTAHGTAPNAFSRLPAAEAAAPLIEVLREEQADVLTIYDPAGGYGHPDHRQVHAAGLLAGQAARTPLVLEATIDREQVQRLVRLVVAMAGVLPAVRREDFAAAYTARADLTHRIDVRRYAEAKRAALRAHASQASADQGTQTLQLLLKLPLLVFRRVLGSEWFVEHGRPPGVLFVIVFACLRTV